MHGLVLLDENNSVLRNAILWNDVRTTKECEEIYKRVGKKKLLDITKNLALEGFTLPKILWVKNNEPKIFKKVKKFLLPKDYVRYKITGEIHTDYSDAAGTLLLNQTTKQWSREICELLNIDPLICPSLINSHEKVGTVTHHVAEITKLSTTTSVFAGATDNACGAIGSNVLENGKVLASIGTSGVILSYEESNNKDFNGKVHYFNHAVPDAYYTMGVTLSAGHSMAWFKNTFAPNVSYQQLLSEIEYIPAESNGLLFTSYIVGERTPHVDSNIRGSFIGIDTSHDMKYFTRAVLEGITFSLNESIEIFRRNGNRMDTIVSIGGGTKNNTWLQIQADIFEAQIAKLTNEQGSGMRAAILAAVGCGWYKTLKKCASILINTHTVYYPKQENSKKYKELYSLYQEIYGNTKHLDERLKNFRY